MTSEKVILCYGDSNTWGCVPHDGKTLVSARYPRNIRWTGILQNQLADSFYIIEEGLNSRTTNLDYQVPPNRNGKIYLAPCLYSHAPIDLVILALGGNDLKVYFDRSAEDIRDGLSELIDIIQVSNYGPGLQVSPKILILPPPVPLPIAEQFYDGENKVFVMQGAIKKAKKLAFLFERLADNRNCYFLDLTSNVAPSGVDGLHYDEDAHRKIAEMVLEKIKTIF